MAAEGEPDEAVYGEIEEVDEEEHHDLDSDAQNVDNQPTFVDHSRSRSVSGAASSRSDCLRLFFFDLSVVDLSFLFRLGVLRAKGEILHRIAWSII